MLTRLVVCATLCALCLSANAALEICNKTSKSVSAAIMTRNSSNAWISRGWYDVPAKECVTLIEGDLKDQAYYYYATSPDGSIWHGSKKADRASGCIADEPFRINDAIKTCEEAGGEEVQFGMFHIVDDDFRRQRVSLVKKSEDSLAQNDPIVATPVPKAAHGGAPQAAPGLGDYNLLTEQEKATLSPAKQDALQMMRQARGDTAPPAASSKQASVSGAGAQQKASQATASIGGFSATFGSPQEIEKACQVLHAQLDRPKLRSEKINIGHYTDIFTPPQTKSECTNIKDTGVPDPSTCTTEIDPCADEWHGPFGTWGCIPGPTTRCTNIKVCDTYAHYKKTMECDLQVQLKLPNFIEQPVSKFLDDSYTMIESTRKQVATSLPLACAPADIRASAGADPTQAMVNQITATIQKRIRAAIEREARQWVVETGVTTIAAAIPSGGLGGAAAMSTSIAQFVYRAHRAIEPIIKIGNDVKATAEDLGFSTSCGWNEWHPW